MFISSFCILSSIPLIMELPPDKTTFFKDNFITSLFKLAVS